MITFSYNTLRGLLRTIPICPKPKTVGLENIPEEGPIIYAHNHITRRTEGFFLMVAAPSKPNIRGLGDITLTHEKYLPTLRRDIEDAIFPKRVQKKINKNRLTKFCCNKFIYHLARWVIAQTNRYGSIGVELNEPTTEEEKRRKQRINKQALDKCIETLEDDIPLAIAPSAGKTYETVENPVYNTVVPTLASWLYRQGKVVKIVPGVVKEKPMVCQKTYWHYVADRIFVYKAIRWLLNLFKVKKYNKPCLTVEFLPPLFFKNANPSKSEKVEFVKNLQQVIYDTLKKDKS
ncbi:MAG: hypothetical protein GTO16_00220 [Candidatus Aminicenantes bacterium]|nr:hypothetical protein [Candidatus Aminicenantes bacterium]